LIALFLTARAIKILRYNKTFAKYSPDRVSGSTLVYTTQAQRTRAFNTATSESYSLNSRLLQDFEVSGLEDLVTSPEVYWNSEAGFVSVNVSGKPTNTLRARTD
jgi:lipopolysaccharide export system protein LptC